MSMQDIVQALEERKKRLATQGGGPKYIERQHGRGKLLAWERVNRLMDPGTFTEFNLWSKPVPTGFDIDELELPREGIMTGYGEVNGQTVVVYADDYTVQGASMSAVMLHKRVKAVERALKMMVPFVALVDSGGIRIQDSYGRQGGLPVAGGSGIGKNNTMFTDQVRSSGIIPQISVMLGTSVAGSAYGPMLTDFLIFRTLTSRMYISPPSVIKQVTFEDATEEEIGGAKVHAEISGSCDIKVDTDEEAIDRAKELLSFFPSNYKEKPPAVNTGDDPNRRDEDLLKIVPVDPSQPYDMHEVIRCIVDNGYFLEIKALYARNVIVGFARLDGQSVGIVANNPLVNGGCIDANSSDKEARFIRFCDCFNIPLVFLADTVGYLPGVDQGREGLIRHAAKVIYAICESTVPKITVYIGQCFGPALLAMCHERMGGDMVFSWPTARVGLIEPGMAVDAIYKQEIEAAHNPMEVRQQRLEEIEEKYADFPYHAASVLLVEDIIDPRETRPVLVKALKRLVRKEEPTRPWKEHDNIPL